MGTSSARRGTAAAGPRHAVLTHRALARLRRRVSIHRHRRRAAPTPSCRRPAGGECPLLGQVGDHDQPADAVLAQPGSPWLRPSTTASRSPRCAGPADPSMTTRWHTSGPATTPTSTFTAPTRWTSIGSWPSSMPTATGCCGYPPRADLWLRGLGRPDRSVSLGAVRRFGPWSPRQRAWWSWLRPVFRRGGGWLVRRCRRG